MRKRIKKSKKYAVERRKAAIPRGGIGILDSGIGGLTVLAECKKLLPNEVFYYYGDRKHAPYGNLPPRKIKRYVFRIVRRFSRLQAKAVVLACNTATAVCIDRLRARFSFPIIGTEPAVAEAAPYGGNIFVLTTRATYASERFRALCARTAESYPEARIQPIACDGLAGEIERSDGAFTEACKSLLPVGKPDAVVLGCTHYIYIGREIARRYGCKCYDGNRGVSRRLFECLNGENVNLQNNMRRGGIIARVLTISRRISRVFSRKRGNGNEANECSFLNDGKGFCFQGETAFPRLFFLGENGVKEREIYERMFVFR